MKNIIVLGSINMDLVVSADRAPVGGETLSGNSFQTIPGGKGANQAVAVARQGSAVTMLARVGKDGFGDELVAKLVESGVDVCHIKRDPACPTGVAFIIVEKTGQNRILIVAGANGQVSSLDVDEAEDLFDQCDYLVMQLEVPLPTIQHAVHIAKRKGVKVVLNAAPAPASPFDDVFLQQIDYLLVNETEAAMLASQPVTDLDSATLAARSLQHMTRGVVILTLGEKGALAADQHNAWLTPGFKVSAIDTTAAGDAFTAGLVTSLQCGHALSEAVIYANATGALATTKFGAQPSLPIREEVEQFLLAQH